ncbi:uncharacterized protein TNCV_1665061 [Trichonephila clavipes]|uniref:Uncharacterized protein n=1 Tax=Trichonephila clavipes TaxID=2585209 RepID=A0A8X6RRJ6_TRICX|nr:uncharacterized protein TNCV_1665061 [Trichonephila clavipes]
MDELIEMQKQGQDIEELESFDPVQSEDRMTVGKLTRRNLDKWLQISENINSNKEPVGSLVVKALDSRPDSLGSMPVPPNTLRVHMEYVLVKSVDTKVLWAESRVQGTEEYFPPLRFPAKIVEVGIGGVAIHRPSGKFRRANSYCHLYDA